MDLTIATVTFNNDTDLVHTLDSIEHQIYKPSSVVIKDGCTGRLSPPFLKSYSYHICYDSTKDLGIFDAMNISLLSISSEYVLFLNSGDVLYCAHSLSLLNQFIDSCTRETEPDVVFLPWTYQHYRNQEKKIPSFCPLKFNHQAVIYRANLHHKLGLYPSCSRFTAADYFFFRLASLDSSINCQIVDLELPFASVDGFGASSALRTPLSVVCIDYLFGLSSRFSLVLVALIHPVYYASKIILLLLWPPQKIVESLDSERI